MAVKQSTSPVKARNDLTADYVRSILNYDPESGIFRWKERGHWFQTYRTWNTKHAGKVAGNVNAQGYISIGIDDHPRKAHRIAWFWMTGEWAIEVDHKDRDRTNNKWDNLREATGSKNQHNRSKSKNNTSGYKGVIRVKRNGMWDGKWIAKICVNGKTTHSRQCDTPEAAHAEYCIMAHLYHGEFARGA
ncbi:HNH endonuclease [Fimbriiglobus ruber]|uniref:HNH endonuclease n=1 Tax=Fimbriiglobus ruber TaxID=1908690 RepID=UPI000B4C0218|nr:HNH endonuclease [Fimbriiglobus ruber]